MLVSCLSFLAWTFDLAFMRLICILRSSKKKQKKKCGSYPFVAFLKFGVQFCHFSVSFLEFSSVVFVHFLEKSLGFFSLVLDGCLGLLCLFPSDHGLVVEHVQPIVEVIILFLDPFQLLKKRGNPLIKVLYRQRKCSLGIWISQQKVAETTTHRSGWIPFASLFLMSGFATHLVYLVHAEVYPVRHFNNWSATLEAFWKLLATLASLEPGDTCCTGFVS